MSGAVAAIGERLSTAGPGSPHIGTPLKSQSLAPSNHRPSQPRLPSRQQGSVFVLVEPVLCEKNVEPPDQLALGLVEGESVAAQVLHRGQIAEHTPLGGQG